jgi:DNA modification methylase
MILVQHKLDVIKKSRSNFFDWRGQFTPEFIEYVLSVLARKDDVVIDPFSGSGTVLLECVRKNLRCLGFEINPAAFILSEFYSFSNVPLEERSSIYRRIEKKIDALTCKYIGKKLFIESFDYRFSYRNLLEYSRDILRSINDRYEKILLLHVLFSTENSSVNDLNLAINQASQYIKKLLLSLPYSKEFVKAFICDARLIHKKSPSLGNLIITSPPYINVFNYHQNHRALMEQLGWNILKIAQSEFGSNRKNRGNRFKTVVEYALDMEQALLSFYNILEKDGIIVLVVGRESNVRRTPFYNGKIIKEIAEAMGCFCDIENHERSFLNKFGNCIKEDILILKKDDKLPSLSNAMQIARKHLKLALKCASGEVVNDINDAISIADTINPSPYFETFSEKI